MIPNHNKCYGCGGCAAACHKGIIQMELAPSGFIAPVITDASRCSQCGACDSVCPMNLTPPQNDNPSAYAGWSKDSGIRLHSASGGIASELASFFVSQGGDVCGAIYDCKRQIVRHCLVKEQSSLPELAGSKYLQSFTVEAFRELKSPGKHMVFGTPCQIAAIDAWTKRMHRREDFILVDFFCHGVPSYNLWNKYLQFRTKGQMVVDARWRDKTNGWHDSWNIALCFSDGKRSQSRKSKGDLFYRLFLGNYCLNPVCYDKCYFKQEKTCADIRLGDLWGGKYAANQDGVSGILVFTDRGKNLLAAMDNCEIVPEDINVVMEKQIKKPPRRPWGHHICTKGLQRNISLKTIAFLVLVFNRLMNLPKRIGFGNGG